jgi:hypothetical protein
MSSTTIDFVAAIGHAYRRIAPALDAAKPACGFRGI